jgi:hypothetical protein
VVIPEPHDYLSFLMGAAAITDADLTNLGVTILERHGSSARGLLVPAASLPGYSAMVGEKLSPGFWNEVVGHQSQISRLCSSLNDDPIEATSDVPRYLAGNPFYRELIAAFPTGDRPPGKQGITSGPA